MAEFSKPYLVQIKGQPWAQTLLKFMGWRYEFEGLPTRQGVAIVYSHTSNWDAPLMFLMKWAIGIEVKFWGKDSLFRIPLFGAWLRWIGGVPVQRTHAQGVVGQMTEMMRGYKARDEYFWLALAPEGTRKYLPGLRSGFYRVAAGADVPIMVVTINYKDKLCKIKHFLRLSGNEAEDMTQIAEICKQATGLIPQNMAPVVLIDPKMPRNEMIVK